jgi:hypothetical protein
MVILTQLALALLALLLREWLRLELFLEQELPQELLV